MLINRLLKKAIVILIAFYLQPALANEGVYQEPRDYIDAMFSGSPPDPKVLWLKGDTKEEVEKILEHSYSKLRVKYWLKDGRSVWILEEIGKEKPITTGVTISGNQTIENIKVLVFRESRGWEVKYTFFTDQFTNASIKPESPWYLDTNIDGITGATLSVDALQVLARMAVYLHQQVAK